jgi:TrmH family RNA methyltransferase
MLIKSQVKYIQSLGHKKHRDDERVFIAEGPKLVNELLLETSSSIQKIYAVKEWLLDNEDRINGIEVLEITNDELQRISHLATANQVLAIVKQFEEVPNIQFKGKIVLALDTIQDPGNLGTIIRLCDWFGIEQLICSRECADRYNSKVVQASMGSIARVKTWYTDIETLLSQQNEVPIYVSALDGQDITTMNKIQEGIIVIGNESKGVSPSILNIASARITIPGKGKAESLNAAVAAGIILSYLN